MHWRCFKCLCLHFRRRWNQLCRLSERDVPKFQHVFASNLFGLHKRVPGRSKGFRILWHGSRRNLHTRTRLGWKSTNRWRGLIPVGQQMPILTTITSQLFWLPNPVTWIYIRFVINKKILFLKRMNIILIVISAVHIACLEQRQWFEAARTHKTWPYHDIHLICQWTSPALFWGMI